MFIEASRAIADRVTDKQCKMGLLFPLQSDILDAEVQAAQRVAKLVFNRNLARADQPKDINAWFQAMLYKPEYAAYLNH